MTELFNLKQPELEDYWRSIILLGRNVTSYKFSLAKSLLELNPQSGELIKIEDLAPVFSKHISEHLKLSDKQATSKSSTFLNACREFNKGDISHDRLIDITIKYGFQNVIDAFHVVRNGEINKKFYIDERKQNKGIRITDELSELSEGNQIYNLDQEVEARWRLVETAWELDISRNLLQVRHDEEINELFVEEKSLKRRVSVTGSRNALNGYQKGKCFYCCSNISLQNEELQPDVDHFFPDRLKNEINLNQNGIWNLVLACKDCNRGVGGKFDMLPEKKYLERLHRRNEFLISSHHPLRETLILQTGKTSQARIKFLEKTYNDAWAILIQRWETVEKEPNCFGQ